MDGHAFPTIDHLAETLRGLDSDRLAECLERSEQPLDEKDLQMLG